MAAIIAELNLNKLQLPSIIVLNILDLFQRTPLDVSYFDTVFTAEPIKLTPVDETTLDKIDQRQFKGFSFTNKLYTLH